MSSGEGAESSGSAGAWAAESGRAGPETGSATGSGVTPPPRRGETRTRGVVGAAAAALASGAADVALDETNAAADVGPAGASPAEGDPAGGAGLE